MTKPLRVLISILFIGKISFAQNKHTDYSNQKFSADTVKHTIEALTKELSVKHPGFHRYISKEKTGGCYQGNNSGMLPETNVEPFNFTLTVPLQKFYNYVDTSKNIGRGTMPDYPVNMTMDDVLKGKDIEMAFAVDLIRKGVRN